MENQDPSTSESTRFAGEDQQSDDVADVEKLEEDVEQLTGKLSNYRSTLPEQLKSTLTSILISHRPILPIPDHERGPEPGTSGVLLQGSSLGNSSRTLTPGNDERAPDEVELLRDKISSNISAMPNLLKRVNECISRIDKLVSSSNETIHPAFKRKKS